MLKIIVAVKDRAVEAFGQPFFVRHTNEAIRSFKEEINRSGSDIGNHADDYDLYHLGTFDDESGTVVGNAGIELIVRGKDLIQPKE